MDDQQNTKVVLYLAGGAMTGVFGAGVMTVLEEAGVYDNIEAVYGTSAGALNGAYFLTQQSREAASVYWDQMTHDVIDTDNLLAALTDRLIHRFVLPLKDAFVSNIIDIDRVIEIARRDVPLDAEKLSRQPIPFFVKLLNVQTGAIEYKQLNNKSPQEVFAILKASVSIIPYYFPPQKIGEHYYADGGVSEPIGIDAIRENHPESTIVTLINMRYWLGYYVEKIVEALIADFTLRGVPLFSSIMRATTSVRVDMKTIQKDNSIVFIHPPKESPTLPYTTDPHKLQKTYRYGKGAGKRLVQMLFS